jgi:hypothetical protein
MTNGRKDAQIRPTWIQMRRDSKRKRSTLVIINQPRVNCHSVWSASVMTFVSKFLDAESLKVGTQYQYSLPRDKNIAQQICFLGYLSIFGTQDRLPGSSMSYVMVF